MSGFFVWSPEGRPPTYLHDTLKSAMEERDRLAAINPDKTFHILAPIATDADAIAATGYDRGLADAERRWRWRCDMLDAQVRKVEAKALRLAATLRPLATFEKNAETFQAIVADCALWFDGFRAAFLGRDTPEPRLPDRSRLSELNSALQRLVREGGTADELDDEEIPF